MGQTPGGRRAVVLGLSLGLLLTLAAAIIWGPHLGRHWIVHPLAATLGLRVEIDRIIHRPWRGEIELQGLRLQARPALDPSKAPGATVPSIQLDRLRLQLRLRSLLSRSLHVSDLLIEHPKIALHRDAQGAFDLADVWARLNAPREATDAWDWRIDRLQVRDGEASLQDAQVQSTLGLEALRLDASELTPQGIGARAELSGQLLGASVALQARLEGSAQDPLGLIDLSVTSLDLVRLVPWIQTLPTHPLPNQGELKQGRLTQVQTSIRWQPQAPGPERLSLQGQLSLADLHWTQDRRDDAPWTAELQLEALRVAFGPTTPLGGEIHLTTLDLQRGRGRWRDLRQTRMPELVLDEVAVQSQDLLWPLGPEADRKRGRLAVQARIDGTSTLHAACELMPDQILTRARIRQWQAGPWLEALLPASSVSGVIAPVDLDGELTWAPGQARWGVSEARLRTSGWSLRDRHRTLARAQNSTLSSLRAQGKNGQLQIDAMQLDLQQLQILDRPLIPRVSLQGRIGPLEPDLQGAWPLQAALKFGSSGLIETEGTLQVHAPRFAGKLAFKDIDLQLMRPELEQHLRLDVQQGRLSGEGRVQISVERPEVAMAPTAPTPSASFEGALALTDLRTLDRQSGQPLVALRAFNLPEVRLAWRPLHAPALTIDTGPMALIDLDAQLTLEADGRLNLKRILTASPPDPAPFHAQVRLGPLRLTGAQIDFNDQFIQPHYRARLSQLNGSIAPLLGEPDQFSDVDLRGQVDGDTPVEITGQVRALGADPSLDLRAVARGFDLPKLSPYSGKWAGYAIEKGSLTADVRYRLRDNQLQAENRLIIHQLTFGDPVVSPDALKWPVQLAVALLKDAKGVIDLDLPIAGSLSDPQFSVGGLIWRALGNLVLKTVSAPFTALASLLRGTAGASELEQIAFAPGSTELDEDAKRRLSALGQVLTERPEITLELIGQADPLTDREALRRRGPRDAVTEDDLRDLAQGRAQAARRHLREVHGLPQERMFIRAPRWAATDGAEPMRGVSFELR